MKILKIKPLMAVFLVLLLSACGQKGPLIVDPVEPAATTQEALPNEISPTDGTESESEAESETESDSNSESESETPDAG